MHAAAQYNPWLPAPWCAVLQGEFPPELSLEPLDTVQLYDSMASALQQAQQAGAGGAWHTEVVPCFLLDLRPVCGAAVAFQRHTSVRVIALLGYLWGPDG